MSRRCLFDSLYEPPLWVRARIELLEGALDRWSDPTPEGVLARVRWLHHWEAVKQEHYILAKEVLEALLLDVLMVQAERVPSGAGKNCQSDSGLSPVRRTNAEKRAAVLDMLATHPDLSDGEIARRCGVSRQNVSNHRKARAKGNFE